MKRSLYITLISLLLLTSCENMLHKMIEYNGDEEAPVLCINAEITVGKTMKVYVTRSWFFLDENRYVGNPDNGITRRGIVRDASVQMQVNDGEWQALTFVYIPDTVLYGHVTERASYYTCDYDFHAGDKVTIRAEHPDYETVTATEIVPDKARFTVTQDEQRDQVFFFNFSVDALPAVNDEVIFFYIVGFGHRQYTSLEIRDKMDEGYVYDTIVYYTPVAFQRLYSEDFMFSEYNLPRTNHGLYSQNGPLYTSADHFLSDKQVTILLDCAKYSYNGYSWEDTLGSGIVANQYDLPGAFDSKMVLDSVVINVRLSSYSFYRYRATVLANSGSSSRTAPEISLYDNSEAGEGYGDIFSEISEVFDELGIQESFQAYSNVEGGFGHFSFLNPSIQIMPVHADIPELNPYNDYNYD